MKLPSKQAKETIKTVVIFVLLTGVTAFVGGMKYQEAQAEQVKAQAQHMVTSLKSTGR